MSAQLLVSATYVSLPDRLGLFSAPYPEDCGIYVGGKHEGDPRFCLDDGLGRDFPTVVVVALFIAALAFCAWYLLLPYGARRRRRRRHPRAEKK